jgi:hypothetical protein
MKPKLILCLALVLSGYCHAAIGSNRHPMAVGKFSAILATQPP